MAIAPKNATSKRPTMFKVFMAALHLSSHAADVIFGAANLALIVGTVLVLLGTIGAFWSGGIRERYADERISKNEADTASANAEAKDAIARAAEANERAAKASAEAAEATKQTVEANLALERERVARLKIEERLAPRTLTPEQHADFVTRLRRIEGHKINVYFAPDPEPSRLANVIIVALRAAGWDVGTVVGQDLGRIVTGTLVEVDPAAADLVRDAAAALVEALRAENLFTFGPSPFGPTGGGAFSGNPIASAAIRLTIGSK